MYNFTQIPYSVLMKTLGFNPTQSLFAHLTFSPPFFSTGVLVVYPLVKSTIHAVFFSTLCYDGSNRGGHDSGFVR